MRPSLVCIALIAAIATPTCSGKISDESRFVDATQAFSCNQTTQQTRAEVLIAKCTTGCHSAAIKLQGLDLESADPATRLFGVESTCEHKELLDHSTPFAGYIFDKVSEDKPACGARMPFGGQPLSNEEIDCLHILLAPPLALVPVQ